MSRFLRSFSTAATAAWLLLGLLCLAAIGLWVCSHAQPRNFSSSTVSQRIGEKSYRFSYLGWDHGMVWLGVDRLRFNRHDLGGIGQTLSPDSIGPKGTPMRSGGGRPGNATHGHLLVWGRLAWWRDGAQGNWGEYSDWAVSSPIWLIVLLTGIWPAFVLIWQRRRRRQKLRRAQGLCPACGYDLRATPTRCPECGRDVEPSRRIQ